MKLRRKFNFFLQFLHPKFSATAVAKDIMDDTKLGYLFLESKLRVDRSFREIFASDQNVIGYKEEVLTYEERQLFSILRNHMRYTFIHQCKRLLVKHLKGYSYESRVNADLFVENYALELFPPFPHAEPGHQAGSDCRGSYGGNPMNHFDGHYLNTIYALYKAGWPIFHELPGSSKEL